MDLGFLSVALLLVCLLFSAFFSSLETAITVLTAARLTKIVEQKPIFNFSLGLWSRQPNRVLTAILIGNNIANTLAAAIATVLAQNLYGNYAISIATGAVTLTLLLFCEITPKTFARHNSEILAPIGMLIFLPLYGALWPITWVLSTFAASMLKLFGGKAEQGATATEEDIAYMIRLGHEEGALHRQDGHLLQSVIEFKDTVAKEAMVPRTQICSFEMNASYQEVVSRVIEEGHTRWPVYEKNIDNIIGIFHAKDLLTHIELEGKQKKPFALRNFLRPAKFVPDMMKIKSLLKEFQAGKAHLAVVVDEYGGTAGIISLEDVLEEIVGEIRDEYDDEESERTIKQIDSGNYLADGRASIFELGKVLGISFPESDAFDSLGGFLIARFGCMPMVGANISFDDHSFSIKAADEKRIIKVHIHKPKRRAMMANDKHSFDKERVAA